MTRSLGDTISTRFKRRQVAGWCNVPYAEPNKGLLIFAGYDATAVGEGMDIPHPGKKLLERPCQNRVAREFVGEYGGTVL